MKFKTLSKVGMALGLSLLLAACSGDDSSNGGDKKEVNLPMLSGILKLPLHM